MKKLSVIIPAYQAENTLEKCVLSVLKNTLPLEVIIVNDGSIDSTETVCQRLAHADARVKYCTKENAGPGAAREFGLRLASGDYIAFVDADDYLEPFSYDRLLPYLKDSVDILEFGYMKEHITGIIISEHPKIAETCIGKKCALHYAKQCNTTNYMVDKLFRRSIFSGVVFPHFSIGEDAAVLVQLYSNAKECRVVPYALYHYVMSPDSLTRKPFNVQQIDDLRSQQFIDNFYIETSPDLCFYSKQKICSVAIRLYCNCKRWSFPNEYCNEFFMEYKKARQEIGVCNLFLYGSIWRRLMFFVFEISPHLCALLYWRK
jgi:glycosyltransferase involved in cell wall biosynthesis